VATPPGAHHTASSDGLVNGDALTGALAIDAATPRA
jgi:hypothetical protein